MFLKNAALICLLLVPFSLFSAISNDEEVIYNKDGTISRETRALTIGKYVNSLDFSDTYPNLRKLILSPHEDWDKVYSQAQDDLGLSNNSNIRTLWFFGHRDQA